MPASTAIVDFIEYCGKGNYERGLAAFSDLMETINRAEMPIYQVCALPRFQLNPNHVSRFLAAHYQREYVADADTQLILGDLYAKFTEKMNERARSAVGRKTATLLTLPNAGRGR